jgi:FlaG/FlaF family flagellin (archaellin)
MTSPHSETKALHLVVAAVLAVALGFLLAAPSGATTNDGCYPSCTTTSSDTQQTSTSVVEDTTTTTEQSTTTTEQSTTTTEQSTTTVAASSTDSSDGGGSLPVTGGDILVMTMGGFAAVALGGLFLATSKNRKLQEL